ncbi:MAG TPA: hypothetical protein VF226_02785 [Hyphomicrobiaceae bacterium]
MTALTTFRVFYSDGSTVDVAAANPYDARAAARKQRDGQIKKVKRVKEAGVNG